MPPQSKDIANSLRRGFDDSISKRRWFDDLTVGESFQTHARTITAAEIIEFAKRYDAQWFHLDEEAAKRESIFGGLSAPGFQTASLAWGMTVDAGFFRDSSIAGLGLQALRWFKPLLAGDSLTVHIKILALRPSQSRPQCGVARILYQAINQKAEVILSFEMDQLLLRRPSASVDAVVRASAI
jgi:acyl dehydratase